MAKLNYRMARKNVERLRMAELNIGPQVRANPDLGVANAEPVASAAYRKSPAPYPTHRRS